jgi:outer membrane lipoprotein LolB
MTLLFALGGCHSLPQGTTAVTWPERCAALTSLTQYSFTGRVAARSSGAGFSAGIDWQQRGTASHATLSGPMGVGAVQVTLDAAGVSIESASGLHEGGSDGAAALRELLGFEPPFAQLRYWLLACSAPGSPAVETHDGLQRLAALNQDGWQLEYPEYQSGLSYTLPSRLRAHRGDDSLQLVINHWRLP